MSAIIEVRDLRKTFRVSERESGLGATLRAFVKRRYTDVPAVAGISFTIAANEFVSMVEPTFGVRKIMASTGGRPSSGTAQSSR